MKKTEQLQVRLEPELKAEAEAVLSQLGLKPTEFVRMALRQLVMRRGLPFDAHLPNSEGSMSAEGAKSDPKPFNSSESNFGEAKEQP